MAEHSKIEWTDATWNPVRGCTKKSPACKFCYAETLAKRNPKVLGTWGPDGVRVVGSEDHWKLPIRWAKKHRNAVLRGDVEARPFRIFTVSLGDIFEDHPIVEQVRDRIWRETLPALEALRLPDGRPAAVLLLLTKRPEVMARWAEGRGWSDVFWAGCTVEDQKRADERIPHLLKVPAPVRFLSCEPLLGPVDLSRWFSFMQVERFKDDKGEGYCFIEQSEDYDRLEDAQAAADRYTGRLHWHDSVEWWEEDEGVWMTGPASIHWLIIGGESGPHARPMAPDWARSLIRQGVEAGVAVHFKQWGRFGPVGINIRANFSPWTRDAPEWDGRDWLVEDGTIMRSVGKKAAGRTIDGRTWDEVPNV